MKKLFAVLSVLALTFAVVGLNKVSAEKFVADPTIDENDIPVYIMGSIMTTFPSFYDNEAEPDQYWAGAARQYPWNETKLQVKQIGEDGKFTGKKYQVYFAGGTGADSNATAMNIMLLTAADNAYGVEFSRYDAGIYGSSTAEYNGVTFKYRANAGPMDQSLSHVTTNVSGKDLDIDLLNMAKATNGSSVVAIAEQVYNRGMVFDASGRAIWGNGTDGLYESAETPNETALPAEYCYIDGVATRFDDVSKCDKAQVAVVDEAGDPVLDGDGNPQYTEGTEPDYVKGRYVWMWVSNEQWEATYKARTNTVDYLANGWDPEKWDDEFECDGGHMLIAFVNAAQSKFAINDAQAQAANAALVGTEDEGKYAAGYYRKYVAMVYVPAGGLVYDFGYLDKYSYGHPAETYFSEIMVQAYKYGRLVDGDGNGMAKYTTYNFSAKPIYQTDVVVDGVSYRYLDGTQTIEVPKGTAFQPANNITYSGLGKFWSVENNIVSYSSDTSKLELYLTVNGKVEIQPVKSYASHAEMVEEFIADSAAILAATPYDGVSTVTVDDIAMNTTGVFYKLRYFWFSGSTSSNSIAFQNAEFKAKWSWLYTYIAQHATSLGMNPETGGVAGVGDMSYTLAGFLLESSDKYGSGWPQNKYAWDTVNANEWLDTTPLSTKFANFTIDTAGDNADKVYNVTFKCVNPDTSNESTYSIKYVVIDEATPILEIAKAQYLKFTPVVAENGSMTFRGANGTAATIDPAQFATAYNGTYNGLNIKGDDISSKIHYTSATLDFDAPTEGEHKVTAKVYNGSKYVEKTFTVKVEDVTAPVAAVVEKANVQYGSLFNPYDLIQYAYDNVDGNLLDVKGAISVSSPVATDKPKEYTVVFTFSDEAGNYVEKTSKVTVLKNDDAKFEELQAAVEAQKAEIASLNDQIEEVKAQAAAIAAQTAGCGQSSGAIMVGFFAMASLLVVVLKKRH